MTIPQRSWKLHGPNCMRGTFCDTLRPSSKHIDGSSKRSAFCTRHFEMHSVERKSLYFDSGAKPLPERMFTDIQLHHWASMSSTESHVVLHQSISSQIHKSLAIRQDMGSLFVSFTCSLYVLPLSMLCWRYMIFFYIHITGLVQDCSNSSALAMELLQSCTKPSIWSLNTSKCTEEKNLSCCILSTSLTEAKLCIYALTSKWTKHLSDVKPLSEPVLPYYWLDPGNKLK